MYGNQYGLQDTETTIYKSSPKSDVSHIIAGFIARYLGLFESTFFITNWMAILPAALLYDVDNPIAVHCLWCSRTSYGCFAVPFCMIYTQQPHTPGFNVHHEKGFYSIKINTMTWNAIYLIIYQLILLPL